MNPQLVLRDIHQPPAPGWWPPAAGWWIVFAVVALSLLLLLAWSWHRRRRRRAVVALFDGTVAMADTPAARIAAMSELLRRAARRRDPLADRLHGDAWLAFLDAGAKVPLFAGDAGRLLLEGGFRRDADAAAVAALQPLARARYLDWMARG
jgi:hypothetical protein